MRRMFSSAIVGLLACAICAARTPAAARGAFSMTDVLKYPYASELAAAQNADAIAWVRNVEGVRNIWLATGPDFQPRLVTRYTLDDGQELSHLTFAPDGSRLLYVRGGDHDANWPAEGNLPPNPASATVQPTVALWMIDLAGARSPLKLDEGDEPSVSTRGELAYVRDGRVFTAPLEGGKTEQLFFDRGKVGELRWSPDGRRLAFVSVRGDHSFIGVYAGKERAIVYLAPATAHDSEPVWSPDGTLVAFARRLGDGGAPEPILHDVAHPWSIWVASALEGRGRSVWNSPETLAGSYPDVEGRANLQWVGDKLAFISYADEWPHLYSLPAAGGVPLLLTPGSFMVEHVGVSHDRRFLIYDANTGNTPGDGDRRHLYRVPLDRAAPVALTAGDAIEWTPVGAAKERVAFIAAGAKAPPSVQLVDTNGKRRTTLDAGNPAADFPLAQLVVPRPVTFKAADEVLVHGQLFEPSGGASRSGKKTPAVIFVHGGPPRQMLLGWHYMDYYSNAYAVNQYLVAHGFVVLSVNYRLGIGYGRAFHQPEHAGLAGAAEYQDVVAAARFLATLPAVDSTRIGIWGGSYGGYLTALALARDSALFKTGVDLHGVHDWSQLLDEWTGKASSRYEKGDREAAMETAWKSSPDSSIDSWRSPVLLIQGDDDRNVPFQQTVDLSRRLRAHNVEFEELVLPNEIHGFLRHASWLEVDEAVAGYLTRQLTTP